jgi:hypothetical protein
MNSRASWDFSICGIALLIFVLSFEVEISAFSGNQKGGSSVAQYFTFELYFRDFSLLEQS